MGLSNPPGARPRTRKKIVNGRKSSAVSATGRLRNENVARWLRSINEQMRIYSRMSQSNDSLVPFNRAQLPEYFIDSTAGLPA